MSYQTSRKGKVHHSRWSIVVLTRLDIHMSRLGYLAQCVPHVMELDAIFGLAVQAVDDAK